MDTQKLSIGAIAALAFVVFWGGAQLARQPMQSPLESESFLNYVIPKLKKFIPKFSLWDRKFIDRRKLAPKLPTAAATPLAKAQSTAVPTATPIATPKPTAQAAASATPSPVADPNAVSTHAPADTPQPNSDPAEFNPYTGGANLSGPIPTETPTADSQVGEWKMKIYRSPSKQTMNDFVFEFQTGRISKAVFYQVLEDLMKDQSPDIQNLAVYALAATPSFDSLSALLTNKDHLSTETSGMLRVALDGYTKPEKLKILDLALKSENPSMILGSMPLIVKIGSRITMFTADYSSQAEGGRDRRGPTNRIPKNGIADIIETLNHLENSPDRFISQAARDTLNELNYQPPTASRRE